MATRYTPQQGIPYVTPDARPCDLAEAVQAIARAADAKGAGYDADATDTVTPPVVSVSMGAVVQFGTPSWTTVDVNRGTPTDLAQFNGLLLNPGMWIAGLRVVYKGLSGGQGYQVNVGQANIGQAASEYIRDAANTLPSAGSTGWPNQGVTPVDMVLATTPNYPVSAFVDTTGLVVEAQLWAIQIGEL